MNKPVAIVELGGEVTWLTDVLPYKAKLYTHTVKELTDEDLEIITEALLMIGFSDAFINYDLKEKALAILRKAQEK